MRRQTRVLATVGVLVLLGVMFAGPLIRSHEVSERREVSGRSELDLGQSAETGRWLYSVDAIDPWMSEEGRELIRKHLSALAPDAGPLFTVVDNSNPQPAT